MQLDVGSEPNLSQQKTPAYISIILSISSQWQIIAPYSFDGFWDMNFYPVKSDRRTDRRKATHKSPLCNMHSRAQKLLPNILNYLPTTYLKYKPGPSKGRVRELPP